MASVESYEIPEYLVKFIENELKDTYFENMLKSGMITNLSLEKLRYLNYIYLIKTKKYLNIIEKWDLKEKFIKTIEYNIDFYDSKEKSSEEYLTTHVISKHNFKYYKERGIRDKNKNTLLNYAIKNCDLELAESELEYCSYGKPSITGYTPLMNLLTLNKNLYDNQNKMHYTKFNKNILNIKNIFDKMIKRPLACNLYQKNKLKETVIDLSLKIYDLYYFNKLIKICDLSRLNILDIFNIIEYRINNKETLFKGYIYSTNTILLPQLTQKIFIKNLQMIFKDYIDDDENMIFVKSVLTRIIYRYISYYKKYLKITFIKNI